MTTIAYCPESAESIYSFTDDHCNECVHDATESCPHIASAFRGEVKVWFRDMDNGGRTYCAEMLLPGETPRCPNTLELPL